MYNSISYMLNFYYPYLDNLLCLKVDLLDPLYPKHRRFLDTANIATTSPGLPRLRWRIIILYIYDDQVSITYYLQPGSLGLTEVIIAYL